MAKYTTCLECGSVDVSKDDVGNATMLTCEECGNSESVVGAMEMSLLDSFDTLTGAEVKELRA